MARNDIPRRFRLRPTIAAMIQSGTGVCTNKSNLSEVLARLPTRRSNDAGRPHLLRPLELSREENLQ
jgi:hypothetical protein